MPVQQRTSTANATFTGRKVWRTLLVDDHELFRDGLCELLSNEPNIEICGEAEEENDAFEQFRTKNAQLVTVDISLTTGHGLSLVSRIKELRPDTVVLVVSMYDDRVYAERALAAGASGYVCKQSTNKEIIAAVRAVLNGEIYVHDNILKRILMQNVRKKSVELGSEDEQLSDRELEVFSLIGQGRTTHAIAKELNLAVSTIETYRERLKVKLKLDSGTELTRRAILWLLQNG